MKQALYRHLEMLQRQFGCSSLKLSTEDAGNSFAQIAVYARAFGRRIPLEVKIGGPEARNDLNHLAPLAIRAVIVPMVESPYALEKFIETMRRSMPARRYRQLRRRLNLETITAARQLPAIMATPAFREVDQATIGRNDLSRSLGRQPGDPQVWQLTRKLVRALQTHGLPVSVGGGITPRQADELIRRVRPAYLNTRSVAFRVTPRFAAPAAISAALEFEAELLAFDAARGFITRREAAVRAAVLRDRARN
ncbi:MAG TPA: aldolase/citrate lyase family protein [bacterium]|nr:aldolase/citrate lyase family protein [bacterium]